MVFQSHAIWPHLSVFGNVAFPLVSAPRAAGRRTRDRRVGRALDASSSAGSRDGLQRPLRRPAAAARAGTGARPEPRLLLLDEPLSSLDLQLREEMRLELKRLQRELGVTTVYVTHDQLEALALASVVGVMRDGRLEQVGRPREVYERPATRFVAGFVGTSNLIDGVVERPRRRHASYDAARPAASPRPPTPVGARVLVVVRPSTSRSSRVCRMALPTPGGEPS